MPGSDPERASPLECFIKQYDADRATRRTRTLTEYLRLFPGADASIARAYADREDPHVGFLDRAVTDEDSFGPFHIERQLGQGGQGDVYLAEDTKLHRKVALKVLRRLGPGSETIVKRFQREAEVAARLQHSGICGVLDAGIIQGIPYIAMQYVEGTVLKDLIAQSSDDDSTESRSCLTFPTSFPSEPEHEPRGERGSRRGTASLTSDRADVFRIVTLFEKISTALHAAHEAGVVHRDIKPGNIMVTSASDPVILDFGLARAEDIDTETLTRTGDLFGTPAYMAPEQITRQSIHPDRRTDIYALGVTLFEALTCERPFSGRTREALYKEILFSEPPNIRNLNPAVPEDLRIVVQTALAKHPDQRYQTAQAMAEDLLRVRKFQPIIARPPGPVTRLSRWMQRNPRLALAVTGLFTVLLAGLLTVSYLLNREQRLHEQHRIRMAPLVLSELMRRANEDLWPCVPGRVAAMQRWITDAEDLAEDLPIHEERLQELRDRGHQAGNGKVTFDDDEIRVSYDEMRRFVDALRDLRGVSRFGGSINDVRSRIAFASRVQRESIGDHQQDWQEAIEAIRASPIYAGLEVRPQVGLVPLRQDPASGLWEFLHIQSGEAPLGVDEQGRWRLSPATGLILVLVPGGRFRMGAQTEDRDDPRFDGLARRGRHPWVTLEAFFMSKYEMTRAQWKRATGEDAQNTDHYGVDPLEPAGHVRWQGAMDAMRRLGLTLPTDARWEYACRAGTDTVFHTGNDWQSLAGHANLNDEELPVGKNAEARLPGSWDGYRSMARVGTLRANPWGLHNMHGNAMEWCLDSPQDDLDVPARPGDGLRVSVRPEDTWRCARGGSFANDHEMATSAYASSVRQHIFGRSMGLRPARDLDP